MLNKQLSKIMEDKNFLTRKKQPAIKTPPLHEVQQATKKKEEERREAKRKAKRNEVLDGTAFRKGGRFYHNTKAALIEKQREKEQNSETISLLKRSKKSNIIDE